MKDWKLAVAIVALTAIAVVRVSLAQRHFSATHDEPAHIACGYEWLTGTYTLDPSHPPLARVIGALPLRLDASPARPQQGNFIDRANDLLYRGAYETNLARARRGTLVFLAIAVAGVAVLARRMFSRAIAVIAAALFATLPPILGHAGLVTTDLAVVAALPWAADRARARFSRSRRCRAAHSSASRSRSACSRSFSFLVYFAPAALIILWSARPIRTPHRRLGRRGAGRVPRRLGRLPLSISGRVEHRR